MPYTKANAEKGKALYDIYCAICHGAKGDGKGTLVKREKILGVPSYADAGRVLTEGSIYHVMYYGINSMGSYAAQTSIKDRWQIVQYVESLKASLEGRTPRIDKEVTSSMKKVMNTEDVHGEEVDHGVEDAHHHTEDTHGDHGSDIEEKVEEVKEKVALSKKDLLGGKSHHSHKATDKK